MHMVKVTLDKVTHGNVWMQRPCLSAAVPYQFLPSLVFFIRRPALVLISNVMTFLQISDNVFPRTNIPDRDQEYLTPTSPTTDNQFK